ncbi:hypothetical protein BCR44DRAFT_96511 [Catenaria anguillulae PL171]|uniref:Uncharacterized protein n=1 Tax=Catenaria anguillulae PL171 TaxID=765915 RepID=A0A1Y2HVX8_9FUNG|nr:hypothetical protein BCR44DRAFT_96511 [Catenaria anguillulae PL171]
METYEVWKDVVFLIICVIIPGVTALTAHKWLHPSKFARYIHLISAFVVTIGGVLGLTVRFFVVEPKSEVYVSGMIQAAFLFAYFLSLRVRFLYATISCAIQVVVFIVVNGFRIFFVDVKNTGGVIDRLYPLSVSAILLLASNFVISFTLYEQDSKPSVPWNGPTTS